MLTWLQVKIPITTNKQIRITLIFFNAEIVSSENLINEKIGPLLFEFSSKVFENSNNPLNV